MLNHKPSKSSDLLVRIVLGLIILSVLGGLAGVIADNVFIYVLCLMIFILTLGFEILVLIINVCWKRLSGNLREKYNLTKKRFGIIFASLVFLFYILGAPAGIIDEIYLHGASDLIRLLAVLTTALFFVFVGVNLLKRSKMKRYIAGSLVFILAIAVLHFAKSDKFQSGNLHNNDAIQRLATLGYVDWVASGDNLDKQSVVCFNAALASSGLNLYPARGRPEVNLIDMQGNVVHRWQGNKDVDKWWAHAEICKNGDLLVLAVDQELIRLDWDSRVKWTIPTRAHHDVSIGQDGCLYLLSRKCEIVFWHGIPIPLLNDYIIVLSQEGTIKNEIAVYDLVRNQVRLEHIVQGTYLWLKMNCKPNGLWENLLPPQGKKRSLGIDVLHTNSIEFLDRNIADLGQKGDWLISARNLDLVAVIDEQNHELIWCYGPGELDEQHHPTLLRNGNLLIYDNGTNRGFSRIIELDPQTKKIVWKYQANPTEDFFSPTRGACQRLPNGNTLITDSDNGRAFEVTKAGRIVWDFYNPDIKNKEKARAVIYRMSRIYNPNIMSMIKD